jgi:uncharacterized membrane protein
MTLPSESTPKTDAPVLFDAVLMPHRSLSPHGFQWLITALICANLLIGIPLWLIGAWPVVGFMGLDVLLVYWLFSLSYRSGRLRETLTLTERSLQVRRISPEGDMKSWQLDPYWLRVEMDDPPQHESRLTLISRSVRLIIGRFLVPEERLEVAQALRTAVTDLRQRRFAHHWDPK